MTIVTIPTIRREEAVSATGRALYETHGILSVPQLFPHSEMKHFSKVFTDKVESDNKFAIIDDQVKEDDILSRYPRFVHPHRHRDTEVGQMSRKLFFDKRIHEIVENLIGPSYAAQSMFHFKPPTARGLALHQDNYFLQAHPNTCLTVWIAVDNANAETGGLIVVPGTHRSEVICHTATDSTVSWTSKGVVLPPEFQHAPVQTDLKPGDTMFFHGSVVHGSNPNTSEHFRRSIVLHYIPQTNEKISSFYFPLLVSEDEEVTIEAAVDGGVCGEAWNIGEAP